MTRPTPFGLVFAPLADAFAAVRAAAAAAGWNPPDPGTFARLPEVQRLLAEVAPTAGTPAEAYVAPMYAAYRFWDAGQRLVAPSRTALDLAVNAPPPTTPLEVPGGACYLQLPAHWAWARPADQPTHEPLDGCFLTLDPRGDEVMVVAALGVRPERAGFTHVVLRAPPGDAPLAHAERRTPPFAPLMNGGVAAGFHSVATLGELLALSHLALVAANR